MNVAIRLFARARDLVGTGSLHLELPDGATIADLRQQLIAEQPLLGSLSPHLLFAVGTDYVTDESPLSPGTEVAVFPPVSGG